MAPALCFPSRQERDRYRNARMDGAGRGFSRLFKAENPFPNAIAHRIPIQKAALCPDLLASLSHTPAQKAPGPVKTLDTKKIQCENYQSWPNSPSCTWEGREAGKRGDELLTSFYKGVSARIIQAGPRTLSPCSVLYPQPPSYMAGSDKDLACDSVNFLGKSSMIPVLPNSLRPESLVDSWTGFSRSLYSLDVSRSCL